MPDRSKKAPKARAGIQSVEVAGGILSAMTRAARPLPLKDLARLAAMGPGKVHRYLVSLVRCGLAVQEADGRYAIGPAGLALGLAGLQAQTPVKLAPEFLRALRDRIGETSVVALWSERGPVVVDLEESARPIFLNIRAGSLLPLASTAIGQVFAAFLPSDTRINSDGRWRALGEALGRAGLARAAQVRAQGLATIRGTLVPGIAAMAAPVFDHRGRIAAVLGFLAREEDLRDGAAPDKAKALVATAAGFTARLGGTVAGD